MLQLDSAQDPEGLFPGVGEARDPFVIATEEHSRGHVVLHGELGEGSRELKRSSDPPPADLVRVEAGDVLSIEQDAPGCGLEAGDHIEHRGLSCPVGANEPHHFSPVDGEAYAIEGLNAAESLTDLLNFEQ